MPPSSRSRRSSRPDQGRIAPCGKVRQLRSCGGGVLVARQPARARARGEENSARLRALCAPVLDETVSFTRMRLRRDAEGQLRIAALTPSSFPDTGNNRRHGAIVMLGGELQDLHGALPCSMSKWLEGRVIENRHWTKTLFRCHEGVRVQYQAGQFVRIGIEPALVRAFSFVNPPEDPVLEFYGIVVPQGRFRRASRNSRLASGWSSRPTPPASLSFPRCRTARRCGSSPPAPGSLRSFPSCRPRRRGSAAHVVLVHAVRHARELVYRDLIEKFDASARIFSVT